MISLRHSFAVLGCVIAVQAFAQQRPVPTTGTQTRPVPVEQRQRNEPTKPSNVRSDREQQQVDKSADRVPQRPRSTNPDALTPEKLWQVKRVSGEAVSTDGQYAYFGIGTPDLKENKVEKNIYRIPVKGGAAQQVTSSVGGEGNVQFLTNGKMLYTHKGHIWLSNADGTDPKQLTQGDASYDNIKVSPTGNKILFTRDVKVNKTMTEVYPDLPKVNAIITDDLMYRHWNEYADEKASHVFVADFNGTAVTNEKDLLAGEPFHVPQMPMGGADDFVWSPDGSYVLYVCKKVSGKQYAISTNTDIYQYNIAGGTTVNVSEGMKGYDTHPLIGANGKTIYWLSMGRDGYESDKNDVMVYDVSTKSKTNLTALWDETVEDYALSADGKKIFILGYTQGTKQLFGLDIPGGKKIAAVKQITTGDHDVASIVGQSANALVVTRTDMNHAPELYTVNLSDGTMQQLTHVNDEFYAKLPMCKWEKRWITTVDNQKMMTWVVYPPDFDPSRKYPALLYCQGGPQSALSQFYSFRWNFQLMASQGYIVIAPNRRGMPGHGVKWNEAISKDWGGQAIKDYLTAADSIGALPFVDKSRIGAVGASYGGYSVYMLAGVHNNRFKTFISHCGLFNLKSWYGTTEEMWFANWDVGGPYWLRTNAELYQKADPINFAQNWNTPIFVIHGAKDFRVPENQGMEAFQLAQLKGIKSRFLLFPDEGHWVQQPQNGLLWQREFYKWLAETL